MGSKNAKENARVVSMSIVLNEQLAPDQTPHIGLSHVAAFDAMDAVLDQGVDAPPVDWTSVVPIELVPVVEPEELEVIDDSPPTTVFSEGIDPKARAINKRRMARKLDGTGKLVKDLEHGKVAIKTVVRDGNIIDDKPLPPEGVAVRLGVRESEHARRARQAQALGSKAPSERTEVEEGISVRDADLYSAEPLGELLQGVRPSSAEEVVVFEAGDADCVIGHQDVFEPKYDPYWRAESVQAAGINGVVVGDEALLDGVELPESLEGLRVAEEARVLEDDQELFDYGTTARDLREQFSILE